MDILQKRTWAQIDLDAAAHNFKEIRRYVGNRSMVCCVIKADAYGHGAVRMAEEYEALGADWLALSNIEEALQVRRAGIKLPLLVLGALLGGLVGAIPAVLMRDFGSYLVAVLYALIPLGANYGYRLFKGKRNKAAFFVTIVFSVLDMFLMRLGMYFVYVVGHYHMVPSLTDVVEAYFQSYGAAQIGPDLLFLALGLWIAWGGIRRTGAHEVQEAVMVAQTLLPDQVPAAQGLDTPVEED